MNNWQLEVVIGRLIASNSHHLDVCQLRIPSNEKQIGYMLEGSNICYKSSFCGSSKHRGVIGKLDDAEFLKFEYRHLCECLLIESNW